MTAPISVPWHESWWDTFRRWVATMAKIVPPRPPATRLGGRLGFQEDRRNRVDQINDFLIKPTRVSGFQDILFTGDTVMQEVAVDVVFPVWFVDRPAMSFGAELERDILEEGNFPMISVVVVKWVKVSEEKSGGWFTGAQLAIVASGRKDERMTVHWQAEAKALRLVGEA